MEQSTQASATDTRAQTIHLYDSIAVSVAAATIIAGVFAAGRANAAVRRVRTADRKRTHRRLILGDRHLAAAVASYLAHGNAHRPIARATGAAADAMVSVSGSPAQFLDRAAPHPG
jgi:hypothetical protein